MLEVIIDGERTHVPECTCGKCIVRKKRDYMEPSIPYNNLKSTYTDHYPPKTSIKDPGYYNRSMHTSFEGQIKDPLPNGLTSTMKGDYLPYDIRPTKGKGQGPYEIVDKPFMGRTTNQDTYPNWGAPVHDPNACPNYDEDIKVPLRGQSNYTENYVPYPVENYKMREPLNFAQDHNKPFGKLNDDTTYNTDYTPKATAVREPEYNPNLKSNAFKTPDFAPSDFDTTYRKNYINYDDKMCRLRKYLNARGIRYLVI